MKASIKETYSLLGVMIRNGYWFNLDSKEWESKRFPPYTDVAFIEPDAMYNFRGKPTIFGNPLCGDEGACEFTEVLQYSSDTNTWESLGKLLQSRLYHEVIEVPGEFCEEFASSTASPSTTGTTLATTTESPTETIESVAMIIGGLWDIPGEDRSVLLQSVELFGCPGTEDTSLLMQDYPGAVYFTAGTHYPDGSAPGRVVVCGGIFCNLNTCNLGKDCFQWTPEDQWQAFDDDNDNEKFSHFMALVRDIDSDSDELVPLVLGLTQQTEIYDPESKQWKQYRELDGNYWVQTGCIVQYEENIYHVDDQVTLLNTSGWEFLPVASVPEFLQNPGRCAIAEIGGYPGMDHGYI